MKKKDNIDINNKQNKEKRSTSTADLSNYENFPIGDIIRSLRKRKNLKLKDVAYKAKVTYIHLSNIEKNKRIPSEKLIKKLSKILANSKKEQEIIYKKLLLYRLKKKIPSPLKKEILLQTEKQQHQQSQPQQENKKMPETFLTVLKKDYEENKDKAVLSNIENIIENAIAGTIYLSYSEVEKIAETFGRNKDIYLILAGYLPDGSVTNIFKTETVVENFLNFLNCLKNHVNANEVLKTLMNILSTFSPTKTKTKEE
ncbi:MAG: helix-turn-helix transcriptional regulator [Elusimicrobiota bacterium]|nr:helix-turn-helix transcriptional regulator [Endomicrobiia bacterium]MDW8166630.1 helix-turn-helix transcriptional regulator [Elusimicrobiota bacterium]